MSKQPYHLIIFGPQGSGKGTQANHLANRLGLMTLGTGDIFRDLASEDSELGREIDRIINKEGRLVPDDLTNEIVSLRIGEIPPNVGFILDGYPRRISQAEALRDTLRNLRREVPKQTYLNLQVPRRKLLDRLAKRAEIEGREDDSGPALEQRLKSYEEETVPILEAVKEWATVIDVNGDQPINEVTEEIIAKLPRELV